MRKAISDPLARFDPEISLDMSYDSPPVTVRPAAKVAEAAVPKNDALATPGGAGDAPAAPPSVASCSTPSDAEFALARDPFQCCRDIHHSNVIFSSPVFPKLFNLI